MIARAIATALLLNFACQMSSAGARGGAGTADHPWNSEHISQLPAEVRSAISHLCGPSLRAAHYFATYSENSQFLNLHFEHSHCQLQNFCTSGMSASGLHSEEWAISTIQELLWIRQ
jgi:hypothetical protein